MTRYVTLREAAQRFGVAYRYLRAIARDRAKDPHNKHCTPGCKHPHHRVYPNETHERFPEFFKDGNSRQWVITSTALEAHMQARVRLQHPRV